MTITTLSASKTTTASLFRATALLATEALIVEVDLTPKPGLVDKYSNGAHDDMTSTHFYRSAAAISPWFEEFLHIGARTAAAPMSELLRHLRHAGIQCERDMMAATDNVNTHKGAIFAFGLACGIIGRRFTKGQTLTTEAICADVATMCSGMVERELANSTGTTAGHKQFRAYGVTGARGEAESGFATMRTVALPAYSRCCTRGESTERGLLITLLELMSRNDDTNVLNRGGLVGLNWIKTEAQCVLQASPETLMDRLFAFDQQCIKRHLSPGGSADLLALTWFFTAFADMQAGKTSENFTTKYGKTLSAER